MLNLDWMSEAQRLAAIAEAGTTLADETASYLDWCATSEHPANVRARRADQYWLAAIKRDEETRRRHALGEGS